MAGSNVKSGKKGRNSSIELLRILCLALIFWMHSASSYTDNSFSAWVSIAVEVIGNIGVSCFILISGYYGIRLDVKKLLRLDLMLIFYSWIGLAFNLAWGVPLGMEEVLSYLLPVIGKRSWYFTCYFALAALSPFLNEAVEKMGEARLRQLLVTMLVIFSGVTTFFFFDITGDGGKGIVHMVMLYLLGRYIGIYREGRHYPAGKLLGAFAAVAGVNFCLNGALYLATGTVQNRFARDNTLFTVAEAVLLFLLFREKHFENALVNRLARHVPAVFIFEWTMRGIMTRYLFDYLALSGEAYYEFVLLFVAVLLVALGSAVDWLRTVLFAHAEAWAADTVYGIGVRLLRRLAGHPSRKDGCHR